MVNKISPWMVTFFLINLLFVNAPAWSDVVLPRVISDGMVVQRGEPIAIWGWATTEKSVAVKLGDGQVVKAPVKAGGWKAMLPAQKAGGPYKLVVQGANMLVVNDVLVGELWVASGQSNMETPMSRLQERFPEEFLADSYPMIRQFSVPKEYDFDKPRKDLTGGSWATVKRDNLGQFSAVAYYFAKALYQELQVPVGIVLSAHGGATAEGWMSEQALADYPHYLKQAKEYADQAHLAKLIEQDKKTQSDWYDELHKKDRGLAENWSSPKTDISSWPTMNVPGYWEDAGLEGVDGVVWFKRQFNISNKDVGQSAKLKLGRIVDADKVFINGVQVGETGYQYPPRRYDIPAGALKAGKNDITVRIVNNGNDGGFVPDNPYLIQFENKKVELSGSWHYQLGAAMSPTPGSQFNKYISPLGFYNAMLAPILGLQIKGVIWYQGESNVSKSDEYYTLFPALIKDWRRAWDQGNFPFIYVQLANYLEAKSTPEESAWANAREAQRSALAQPNTAMAVAIDVGQWNDIHPTDKQTVGKRLALAARSLAYGEKDVVYSGPEPVAAKRKDGTVEVTFKYVADGLDVKGKKLNGFALAGENKKFYWAEAKVKNNKIVLSSKEVKKPRWVRYAWADNPDKANLYNSESLPAVPFQVEVK